MNESATPDNPCLTLFSASAQVGGSFEFSIWVDVKNFTETSLTATANEWNNYSSSISWNPDSQIRLMPMRLPSNEREWKVLFRRSFHAQNNSVMGLNSSSVYQRIICARIRLSSASIRIVWRINNGRFIVNFREKLLRVHAKEKKHDSPQCEMWTVVEPKTLPLPFLSEPKKLYSFEYWNNI